jgi:serine/threonine-protein kinase
LASRGYQVPLTQPPWTPTAGAVEDGEERAYLTDFGLAKRFDAPTALTVKGAVVGTVGYMPPEQISGNHTDARSDIYAVGCVLFQMLTGKVPYEREHSVATLFAHVYDPPPALEGSVAASHPTLGPVIAKAMAKDPADRYLSAGDLARDALAALGGARYAGPPTIVGTGEARPDDGSVETPAAQADAALDVIHTATQQAGPPTSRGAESELATEIRDGSERPPFVEDLPSPSVPAPIASGEATVIGQGVGTPAAPGGAMSADSGAAAPSGGHTSGGGPAVQLPATTLASHA